MKKITLGFMCLFSLVLCVGVHAMNKASFEKKGQCWQTIYNVVARGGGMPEVERIVKITEWVECKNPQDQISRDIIRFVVEVNKALLYATEKKNWVTRVSLSDILDMRKKKKRESICGTKYIEYILGQKEASYDVVRGIGEDCYFLDANNSHCLVWSARQGFVETIRHLTSNYLFTKHNRKICYDRFEDAVLTVCGDGKLKVVKCLIETVGGPTYLFGDGLEDNFPFKHECETKTYFLCPKLAKKYAEEFASVSKRMLFYDRAFLLAVEKGYRNIAEYLLTSDCTKDRISDCIKVKLILEYGVERGNFEIVDCMMDFERRGLIKYDVKILEAVSGYMKFLLIP